MQSLVIIMAIIKRAITQDGAIRVYCIDSSDIVKTAYAYHHTTPVASAALGRTLTMCAMMRAQFKGDSDSVTILIKGDGPLGGVVAAGNATGVRGYVYNPAADVPNKKNGKLDVGGAIGKGALSISRDLGLKEPYVGKVPLVTGEIAEDFTYYYAMSEQVPTAIALGVLIDVDCSVKNAGGYMVQLMPEATEADGIAMEKAVNNLPPITQLLDMGVTPDHIIGDLLAGRAFDWLEDVETRYVCECSDERIQRALISLGRKELEEMIAAGKEIEITCQFCPKVYHVPVEQIQELLHKCTRE